MKSYSRELSLFPNLKRCKHLKIMLFDRECLAERCYLNEGIIPEVGNMRYLVTRDRKQRAAVCKGTWVEWSGCREDGRLMGSLG